MSRALYHVSPARETPQCKLNDGGSSDIPSPTPVPGNLPCENMNAARKAKGKLKPALRPGAPLHVSELDLAPSHGFHSECIYSLLELLWGPAGEPAASGQGICPVDAPASDQDICPVSEPAASGQDICPVDAPAASGHDICPAGGPVRDPVRGPASSGQGTGRGDQAVHCKNCILRRLPRA